jgi:hypothetical protein
VIMVMKLPLRGGGCLDYLSDCYLLKNDCSSEIVG